MRENVNLSKQKSPRSDLGCLPKQKTRNKKLLIVGCIVLRHDVFQRCQGFVNNCSVRPRYFPLLYIPDARSSDLLLVLNFESRSWKWSRTDRFETLKFNFGSLMLLSFSALSSQTFLSQLFEPFVVERLSRSTRFPGITLHRVSRTTPLCLTCIYLSERPNVLNKLQLSNFYKVALFSTH